MFEPTTDMFEPITQEDNSWKGNSWGVGVGRGGGGCRVPSEQGFPQEMFEPTTQEVNSWKGGGGLLSELCWNPCMHHGDTVVEGSSLSVPFYVHFTLSDT